ncbi:phospholipase effector Tle1 domain-containing protein [Colwellia sp. MT41]|uniref:phospholipase effector Tle1 domain-containing protein n=1 Tax=Colwellia sp. MT41 TaxID=58049 RepID=UPI0009FB6C5D|nr:DUF2235 domain-containing protein [Colwellia sp. MT41]
MMKKLIFCFDGTCNNPEDVGDIDDDASISNILKLHIFLGGKLTPANGCNALTPAQHSFYYSGIGNRGNWLIRAINAVVAPVYGEMDDILSEAHADLSQHYSSGDEVYIFGFSRGAAIARMFAAHLAMPVKFIGVFDTVAAIRGSLDLDPNTFPASGIVFENDILAPHIANALHILALDERRLWLQPTLFNQDERVKEVWFAGSHSDIGGGYWFDGLADICLQFMLDNIAKQLTVLSVEQLDYSALKIPGSSDEITFDDIVIKPLVSGKIHRQLFTYSHAFTHAIRSVRVNVNEVASSNLAIIHCSVAQRYQQLLDYRPYALYRINYQLLDEQGSLTEQCFGVSALAEHYSQADGIK